HSVIVVRTRGVLVGAQSSLRRIETEQNAQFVAGVRPGWKKVVELIFEVETLVGEMRRERSAWLFHAQGSRLSVVLVRSALGADQFPELKDVGTRKGRGMQSGDATTFTDVADQAVYNLGIDEQFSLHAVQEHCIELP